MCRFYGQFLIVASYLALHAMGLHAQSLVLFSIDNSAYPVMRAEFLALDADGRQITGLASEDLILTEDGAQRTILAVTCPLMTPSLSISSVLTIDRSSSMYWETLDLAKLAAKSWIRRMPLDPSECAVTSFDTCSYLNLDFSIDSTALVRTVEAIRTGNQTDLDKALIGPAAGALEVTKRAKYKKIVLLLTDGGDDVYLENEIITEAQRQGVHVYMLLMKQYASSKLQRICTESGGGFFERVENWDAAALVLHRVLMAEMGLSPCRVEWIAEGCSTKRVVELRLSQHQLQAQAVVELPDTLFPRITITPSPSLHFGVVTPGMQAEQRIILTAQRDSVRIDSVISDNPRFGVSAYGGSAPPFSLGAGDNRIITVTCTPADTAYIHGRLEIAHDGCEGGLLDLECGRRPGAGDDDSVRVIHPNGGEQLVAGTEALVSWDGVQPNEGVRLDYSIDGGLHWTTVAETATDMQFLWRVPCSPSEDCLMRATVIANEKAVDLSDGRWSITAPAVRARTVDMGQVTVGLGRDSLVTEFLKNIGKTAIRIDSIFIRGENATDFSLLSEDSPLTLDVGEMAAITIRFTPATVGVKTAAVVIHTHCDTLTQLLQGEGVLPEIKMLTPRVDFGDVSIGVAKDSIVHAVIRNPGYTMLLVRSTEQLGPDQTQFSILNGGGAFALAPGMSRTMTFRFAPSKSGLSSDHIALHHGGINSPAIVTLVGNGQAVDASATLAMDTISAQPGELVTVPIIMRTSRNLSRSSAVSFFTEIRFNASLLSPAGLTPKGVVSGGERIIQINGIPLGPDVDGILTRLQFIATLGDTEWTPLRFENTCTVGGDVAVTTESGYFQLTDICRDGGSRLFDASRRLSLEQNRPNPFNAITIIEYELIERGPTRLMVTDMLGRTLAVLVDSYLEPGHYSIEFDATRFPSGSYLYVLHTPSNILFRVMEHVK